jgi:hypothetical protein
VEDPSHTEIVRLVIDVRAGSDPIAGALVQPAAQATVFRGWLSLAALIDSANRFGEKRPERPGTDPATRRICSSNDRREGP